MNRPVVHLIAHTHWDREWYLPLGGFRGRLVPLVDQVLDRLGDDATFPAFLLDGQTVLLRDYLALRPERLGVVEALVRAGRLRTGPWYVLSDEQIPAGEALLRNLALGRRDLTALGGEAGVAYSPDAFGHPAALPAVAREFGLRRAVVWRGLSDAAMQGRDLAWWTAPDGARVLVYHLPPDGYEIGSNLLVADDQLSAAWRRVSSAVMPRAATRQVAVLVGADHHAPDPRLASLATRLTALDRAVEFRWSTLEAYFTAAESEADPLPVFTGELRASYGYTWTLQGVHATRAPHKRRYSAVELQLLRQVEPLIALTAGQDAPARRAVLRQAWGELVECQFHDTLSGCSADSVARAMAVRLDNVAAAAHDLRRGALHALCGHDADLARDRGPSAARLVLWNGAARPRRGVVIAEGTFFHQDVLVGPPGSRQPRTGPGFTPFALRLPGRDGTIAPQLLALTPALERRDAARHYPDQDAVEAVRFAVPLGESLPGLAMRAFEVIDETAAVMEEFAAGDRGTIWNGRLRATLGPDGRVELQGPSSGRPLAGLFALESERDTGDSYSFAPLRGDRRQEASPVGRSLLTSAGPLVAGIEWKVKLAGGLDSAGRAGKVALTTTMELLGDSPVLRCRLRLENGGENHRLRLRFPTGLRGVPAIAGAQFGQINRLPVTVPRGPQPMETPVATAPAHRWVAAAKGGRGFAIFAPGFFEYEWTRGGDLLLTLLRSVGQLSASDLATRPGHAGWPTATPEAQCIGESEIELGIALVTEDDLRAPERMEEWWEDAFAPPLALWIRDCTGTVSETSGVELSGEGLVFSSCLPAEHGAGVVLRCYNARETAVDGAWSFERRVSSAVRIRADETSEGECFVSEAGERVVFRAGPRAIVSVKVEWPSL